jgi:hypothetical protein
LSIFITVYTEADKHLSPPLPAMEGESSSITSGTDLDGKDNTISADKTELLNPSTEGLSPTPPHAKIIPLVQLATTVWFFLVFWFHLVTCSKVRLGLSN